MHSIILASLLCLIPLKRIDEEPIWIFTYLKANPNQKANLKLYVEKNWFRMDSIAVSRGILAKYELYENLTEAAS